MYPGETKEDAVDFKDIQSQLITAVNWNVLVLGSGGREHALAWKIAQSEKVSKVYIAPGNAGTASVGQNIVINIADFQAVKDVVLKYYINLVVVGPEQPLVDGIVDFFKADEDLRDVKIIGPDRVGAQLEGSKAFAKKFMEKYGIPTAKCFTVTSSNLDEGLQYLTTLEPPYVLKADGLAAGKGVLILDAIADAQDELKEMLSGKFGAASAKVVIEQFLKGIEVSMFVLTDGENYVILPEAKDDKRIGDGDTGLNTGGMGAVSPVPFVTPDFVKKVEDRIIKPTIEGLKKEKIDYKGFIFLGLMNCGGDPYVIEYNVRMGDPETEGVMTRIDSDFAELLDKCAQGKLKEAHYKVNPDTSVTVMLVSGGYPEAYKKGMKITGLEDVCPCCIVAHAGTKLDGNDVVTSGGRVIAVTAHGKNIEEAREKAYNNAKKIVFEGKNYRHDIGLDLMKYNA
ncbi:MAG: phosphoribosylamine--glycine ligase [Bacteroidales bacterium]|nr:phosphoribosylamine--glycine ligase [Bacteroidales bacterium]